MDTLQLLVQIFMATIVVGGIYSLWQATRAYGGLIGGALKWIGIGMVFFFVEAVDRGLGHLSVIASVGDANAEIVHSTVLILGLLFAGIGFSRLTRISKD
jgi:hypothetical protein